MSNSILYLSGRYLCQWPEFKEVLLTVLNSEKADSSQDEILASLRDGIVYEWLQTRMSSNAKDFEPELFVKMTDSQLKKYLMRVVANKKEADTSINLGEYVDMTLSYSTIDADGNVQKFPISDNCSIPKNLDAVIHVDFKVKKVANEEFSVKAVRTDWSGRVSTINEFRIDMRTKGAMVSFKVNLNEIMYTESVALLADKQKILFLWIPKTCSFLEITNALWPRKPQKTRAILTDCGLVDMGTSVLWFNHNLGAETEYDLGDYYEWDQLEWYLDNLLSDLLPKGYRVPTAQEWEELLLVCNNKFEIVTIDNNKYAKFTSSKTNNELLLPYNLAGDRALVRYWSSTPKDRFDAYTMCMYRHSSNPYISSRDKTIKLPVRPVFAPNI